MVRQVYFLSEASRARGDEARLLCSDGDAEGWNEILGTPVLHADCMIRPRFRGWQGLDHGKATRVARSLMAEYRPHVVHAHLIHSGLGYAVLEEARKAGAGVVFHAHDVMTFCYQKLTCFHGGEEAGGTLFDVVAHPGKCVPCQRLRWVPHRNRAIRSALDKWVDVRVAVSDALSGLLAANGLDGFRVVHNAVPDPGPPVAAGKVRAFRDRLQLGDDPLIGFAGRLHAEKGILQLMRALPAVLEKIPRARLLILSRVEDYKAYALPEAEALGLADRMVTPGWLDGDELRAAVASCSVFTTPSTCFDTFGLVSLDAMAESVPVVGTCFGGTSEVVVDGVTGHIINPFDLDALAGRITDLLEDPDRAASMGAAGRRRMEEKFLMPRLVAELQEIYEEVVARVSTSRSP